MDVLLELYLTSIIIKWAVDLNLTFWFHCHIFFWETEKGREGTRKENVWKIVFVNLNN